MSVETRDGIQAQINNNIFDNNNKEILAAMVREVLVDFKDSYFNLLDDTLENQQYNNTTTLAQMFAASANIPPKWGSTGFFNITNSETSFDIPAYSGGSGIVSGATYHRIGSSTSKDGRVEIDLNLTDSNRKFMVQIHTQDYTDATMNNSNDICSPIIFLETANKLHIGLKELDSNHQDLRIEVFAFTVSTT